MIAPWLVLIALASAASPGSASSLSGSAKAGSAGAATATTAAAASPSGLADRFAQVASSEARLILAPSPSEPAGPARAPLAVSPPVCSERAAGLCDINWQSAPAAFLPRPLPADWQAELDRGRAQALLRAEDGAPLVLVRRDEVLLAFDTTDAALDAPGARLLRWPYLNYLLYVVA